MNSSANHAQGTLAYQTPQRQTPIPLWKHFVFVPLLFWVALFIIGALALTGMALWEILREGVR